MRHITHYAFHSSGSLATRLCNGGVGITPHHNTMLSISYLISRDFPPDRCAGLAGNYKAKVLFEKANSEEDAETTVLQNRMHPSQQKFFDFLGTHISMPIITFVMSGWETALFVFEIRFHYSKSHSDANIIIPFVQETCCTSRRTTLHTASRLKITKPCPYSCPPRRTDCSTSSFFTCRRGVPGAAAAPGGAGGGVGTPNRRAKASVVSYSEEGADLISPDKNLTSPILELETPSACGNGGA